MQFSPSREFFLVAVLVLALTNFSEVQGDCENCNAGACSTQGSCSSCVLGWGPHDIDANIKLCEPCHDLCVGSCNHRGAGKCDGDCADGSQYEPFNHTCLKCTAEHCAGGCSTGLDTCDGPCDDGYGLTDTKQCKPCAKCCKKCTVAHQCTDGECMDGCAYKDLICVPCDVNCLGCLTPHTCNGTCKEGFVFNSTVQRCKGCDPKCLVGCDDKGAGKCDGDCEEGYGISSIFTCIKCGPHCNGTCNMPQGGGFCDGPCEDGYGLGPAKQDTSRTTCYPCAEHCEDGCSSQGAGCCDAAPCEYGSYQEKSPSTGCYYCK